MNTKYSKTMLERKQFLEKYNIDPKKFEDTGLDWENLKEIYNDYQLFKHELEQPAIYVFNTLMKSPKVHSVRYRIKDPEHLIEKIIRKKIDDNNSNITLENYKHTVNDLIGLRALHLFKDDWSEVHEFIKSKWHLNGSPVANFREGDPKEIIKVFTDKECDTKMHRFGYRSVHYIIESRPGLDLYFAEIQVRTIFEEAWSEIDHTIRYPYEINNQIFSEFLLILNRLAGSADEMGSFIQLLKNELIAKEEAFAKQSKEKDNLLTQLEDKITNLNIKDAELNALKMDLDKLRIQKEVFMHPNTVLTKEPKSLFELIDQSILINSFSKAKPIDINYWSQYFGKNENEI